MIDQVTIRVSGGRGGDGCISFRRERHAPQGGPDGGDGGNGGSVFLVGDSSLNTLLSFRYKRLFRAGRGIHGQGDGKHGANGKDIEVRVPVGTMVWCIEETGERVLLADIVDETRVLVAKGGSGGRGNARFLSNQNKEPLLAEAGAAGEERELVLELKLLADVGIVGLPNVGKSTLLSVCSAAKPKIAAYPFTTTEPVLGVAEVHGQTFVLVEIPGLIEGAHAGAGLGDQFLRHAERTKLLLHVLDGTSDDPVYDFKCINEELRQFNAELGSKPQVVVVNKLDVTEVRERKADLEHRLGALGKPVLFISAATREGVAALLSTVSDMLREMPRQPGLQMDGPLPVVRPRVQEKGPLVERQGQEFVINSSRAERLARLANLRDQRVRLQLHRELERMGIVRALEEAGVKPGDTVRLGKLELEWV